MKNIVVLIVIIRDNLHRITKMTSITRDQIIRRAIDSRTNHSINVVKLATDMGIQVFSTTKMKESGKIKRDESTGQISIYVNESEPITRQRFSIAHEIAHYVLHPKELSGAGSLSRSGDVYSPEMEKEADSLAAEILMPEELVKSYIKEKYTDDLKIDKKEVTEIASIFKVSNFVVVIRLRELDYNVPFLDFA